MCLGFDVQAAIKYVRFEVFIEELTFSDSVFLIIVTSIMPIENSWESFFILFNNILLFRD
jgi:hypothetical protein